MLIDTARLAGSHDLRLSAWGPYTKRYIGVSHIPDTRAGLRFDLSLFPGLYRRNALVPTVMWDTGYHPWEAAADLSYFSHRHDVIWKDQLYCDMAYCRLDEQAVLVRCTSVNRSDETQQLALHYAASLHFPPRKPYSAEVLQTSNVTLPPGVQWIDALEYGEVTYAAVDPRANLTEDGQVRGEVLRHGLVDGMGLGQNFGATAGDRVRYAVTVPRVLNDAGLLLRVQQAAGAQTSVALSGLVSAQVDLRGSDRPATVVIPVGPVAAGEHQLVITGLGGSGLILDGCALGERRDLADVTFAPVVWQSRPRRLPAPRANTLLLQYAQASGVYGLAWNVEPAIVREFHGDDLETLSRRMVHEHVATEIRDKGDGHFTNVFMRPIFLPPRAEHVMTGLVCTGDEAAVRSRLAAFDPDAAEWAHVHADARKRVVDMAPNPAGEAYRASQERMAATVLTNVVYPVRTRGTWIRHGTPGRWWDCLYTWDSGFIGLGQVELDLARAVDTLNAYVTEPGEQDAAFIHHGSAVPTQFYLFLELWNRTQDPALLVYFYPRLQQYHRFMAGRLGSSTTRTHQSNLLRTWDYFYNSGGWDDYPPQVYARNHGLYPTVTPVITTSQVIRTAKILRMAALALDLPTTEYDEDIATLTHALQEHAWDEEAGYFSYVEHDAAGRPIGFLRYAGGANFNMGMDGASPLVAAACTPAQDARLAAALMAPERMWCRFGLSTVDQSAPYFRDDGYWNGSVWMAHQWFFWKTLLDMGQADAAHRIAQTALDLWRHEVDETYNCMEHFVVRSGRGAGWHHFGGLSSPVLNWYSAYHRPGRLTTGLDVWVESLAQAVDQGRLTATLSLHGPAHRTPVIIAAMAPQGSYTATWNGAPVAASERYPGVLEIQLPAGRVNGQLIVTPRAA